MNNLNNLSLFSIKSNKKEILFILLLSSLTGLIAQYFSYADEYVFAYRDSIYRLDAARRFIDAVNPGFFNQIGTVWLPLPNLILLPFASIDFLWRTGLAGSIVNFTAYIFNSFLIFYTLKILTKNKIASYAGLILFITNPNILYFQTTAMSEQLYLTFFSAAVYYLIKWNENEILMNIWLAGIFTAMASCTRYDGWTFAIAAMILVFLISFISKNKFIRTPFYFIIPTLIVIIWWLIHNYIYYSDALEFMRGQYSTLFQLKYYESAGRLLTKNNFLLSLKVYYFDLYLYLGWLALSLSLIGFIYYVIKNKFNIKAFIPYLSLIAIPSTIIFLYLGQIIIEIPNSEPPGYFNSRYGLYTIPGIVIFAGIISGIIYDKTKNRKAILIPIIASIFLLQIFSYFYYYPGKVPSIAEAQYGGYKGSVTYNFSKYLENNYDGGNLFFDVRVIALPPWSGINMKERITFYTYEIGEKALVNPIPFAKWVMFYVKSPDDKILNALDKNKIFRDNYDIVFSEDGLELYKRK